MARPAEVAVGRPLPLIDDETAFFWRGTRERRLLMLRCEECGRYLHHPQSVCPLCLSTRLAPSEVSQRGVVYTYTVTEQAFHPFWVDRVPYVIVVVQLPEQPGLRFLSELVDCAIEDVEVGMHVEVVWEVVTDEVTLPMFRSAAASTSKRRDLTPGGER